MAPRLEDSCGAGACLGPLRPSSSTVSTVPQLVGGRSRRALVVAAVVAAVLVLVAGVTPARAGRDFYAILGVDRGATTKVLKKSYRRLSLKYHPDKQAGAGKEAAEAAQAKFMELTEAYEVLSDPEKRRLFDQYGEEGLKQQNERGGGRDPFSMFNFGGGRRSQGPQRGPDVRVRVNVPLRDVYLGATRKLAHHHQSLCPHCRGTGADNPSDVHTCPVCGGSGTTVHRQRVGPGFYQQVQTTCHRCGGKGRLATSTCHVCHGAKVTRARSTHEIVIERGVPSDTEIVFEHAADESPDHAAGHLIFVINVVEDDTPFHRDGNDLWLNHTITLREALTGFRHTIRHIDGRTVEVQNSGVTEPDAVLRIPGEGMPHHNFPSDKGELLVRVQVSFPTTLSSTQASGFRDLFAHNPALAARR